MAYLSSMPDFKMKFKQPAALKKPGFYPGVEYLHYDIADGYYTLSLEGLAYHCAN